MFVEGVESEVSHALDFVVLVLGPRRNVMKEVLVVSAGGGEVNRRVVVDELVEEARVLGEQVERS